MSPRAQQPGLIDHSPSVAAPEVPPGVVALTPSDPNGGVSGTPRDSGMALVIQRLAENPSVDVAKLEKIIELQERLIANEAKAAFDSAFARMQADLPEIDEKGAILNKDGSIRSRFARLEDIQKATRPTMKQYGFAIRHRTEWPADKPNIIRIVGILSHELGHSEESVFEAPADKSDYRTDIQSQGSTVSYGRRYTTLDLLNIITKGVDNDGATGGRPEPPKGYEDFVLKLEAAASKGQAALDQAYQEGTEALRKYLGRNDAQAYAALRKRATERR